MRLLVIYNPNARLATLCSPRQLERELRRHGAEVELFETTDEAVAKDVARSLKPGIDRVVVAGGDGTVSAVIDALAGRQVPLAVIPLGTGNVLAEEAGLRAGRWREACAVAAAGQQTVRIDLGRAGERYFATMFGAGLDAHVVADIAQRQKRNYGRWAFVGQLFRTLARYRPHEMCLTIDGRLIRAHTWLAVVANTRRYAWRLHFVPHACPVDGQLDLCILPPVSRARLIAEGVVTFVLQKPALSHMRYERFRHAHIDCDPPVYWQADGEIGGRTPVDVEVVPLALSVVVATERCVLAAGTLNTPSDPGTCSRFGQ